MEHLNYCDLPDNIKLVENIPSKIGAFNKELPKSIKLDKPTSVIGWVVFHVDVGQLSPEKAEDYIVSMRDKIDPEAYPPGWQSVWIPNRNQGTRIETIKF